MNDEGLNKLLDYLLSLPAETEFVEFKRNNYNHEEIGEYISALSNAACLRDQSRGYLVFGIEDVTRKSVGTSFDPNSEKVKGQELFNWLDTQITPGISSIFHVFNDSSGNRIVIVEINPALGFPTRFKSETYIRVGTYKKKLKDHSGIEKDLWDRLSRKDYESQIAIGNLPSDRALSLIDYPSVFELLKIPLAVDKESILTKLEQERLILRRGDLCDITNLGAILFAKKLDSFEFLNRKAVRVIVYRSVDRREAVKEYVNPTGYATGFETLMGFINDQIPANELIGQALRTEMKMYPELAIRELVANALIHQDLSIKGAGPLVEIFTDRIEFLNPGRPVIDVLRFLDHPPRSRNEKLAKLLRRIGVCEERGSGIDKVIFFAEMFQLPAPDFQDGEGYTRATLYAHKLFGNMDRKDKIRATYQHASLRNISNQQMTNESLRKRFNVDARNYPIVSRIINEAIESKLVKPYDPVSKSKKYAKYVPFWA